MIAQDKAMLEVTSPFDGSLIETIAMQDANDAEMMLKKAAALFKNRNGWLEHHERASVLKKLASLVESEAEDFAMLIAKEGGKPLTDARIEVARAIDGIHLAVKELSHVVRGEEIPMGHTAASEGRKAYTTYEPIGVVVAVSAFNHPLNLIVHQVVPAIAVGCPVIVKPAASTPLNCARFVALVQEAGLPKGWCQLCVCDNDVSEILVTSDKINFFTFIGSAKVGWWLKSKLAPGVRCALEHGGAAPVIVDQTANMKKTIPSMLKGGFYHAGQVCVSVQRVFVHETILDHITKLLVDGATTLKVGDPTLPETEVGPLILPREVDRVHAWVTEAVESGAKLLAGGKKLSEMTYSPTILLNPPENAKVSTMEIFGPVVCVYSYTDHLDAIERANSLEVAFQAAVYTEDLAFANDCIKRLDATAVMVNDHTAFRVDWMPFAGRKSSGYGVGGIGYTMHDMVQIKMVVINEL
ncbi:MAG: aldehyde dehydrogenase family protein [Methylophilaceae bacterium]